MHKIMANSLKIEQKRAEIQLSNILASSQAKEFGIKIPSISVMENSFEIEKKGRQEFRGPQRGP